MAAAFQGRAIKDTFAAWVDKMPIKKNTLHVKGEIEYSGGGWSVELVPAIPQGINPAILILELSERHDGVQTKPIVRIPVKFEKADGGSYKQVTIRSGSPEFTLDVTETH
jgi:hypothetical protein